MASLEQARYSPEQYLRIERAATSRSEYISGEMVAMSGTTRRHSLIKSNLARHIGNQLAGRPCETHTSDLRIHVGSAFFYPDVMVICGEAQLLDDAFQDTVMNPTVIVEVLSRSTEGYDRGIKFPRYGMIPSLRDYILVAQDECRVERFSRALNGEWSMPAVMTSPAETVEIASIGCQMTISKIYAGVPIDAV